MTKSCLALLLLSGLVILIGTSPSKASGHGAGSGFFRPVTIQDEQFSNNQVTTSDFLTVTGQVESRVNRTYQLSPYIYVTPARVQFDDGTVVGATPWYASVLDIIYPLYRDQSTIYFKVEHNLPNPLILHPGEIIPFEIKVYPSKAGAFHIHAYFIGNNATFMGRGTTVIVTGEVAPTIQEITQIYLPIAGGAAALVSLILFAIRARFKTTKEMAIRIFYTIKASFETAWVLGLSVWIAAAYPYLHSLEIKYAMSVGMTAALAAIAFAGYVAVVTRVRKRQRLLAIGTSAATVLFYLALDYTALGNQITQFNHIATVWFFALAANSLASILISMILVRERGTATEMISR